jgi:hypothetical protein
VVDPAVADMLTDMERKKRIANLLKSKQSKSTPLASEQVQKYLRTAGVAEGKPPR